MEGIDSKESLEKQVKENLTARKESDAENKYIDELLDAASRDVKVEIPDVMINEELNRMVKQYEETLRMQGISLEQFYQFTNSDETEYEKKRAHYCYCCHRRAGRRSLYPRAERYQNGVERGRPVRI